MALFIHLTISTIVIYVLLYRKTKQKYGGFETGFVCQTQMRIL